MASVIYTAGKNNGVDGVTGGITYVSLHDGDPGTTGANEISGGSYARKAISWNAAASSSATNNGAIVFDVPSGKTITYLGFWTAVSGGTAKGHAQLGSSEVFGAAGTLTFANGTGVTISAS